MTGSNESHEEPEIIPTEHLLDEKPTHEPSITPVETPLLGEQHEEAHEPSITPAEPPLLGEQHEEAANEPSMMLSTEPPLQEEPANEPSMMLQSEPPLLGEQHEESAMMPAEPSLQEESANEPSIMLQPEPPLISEQHEEPEMTPPEPPLLGEQTQEPDVMQSGPPPQEDNLEPDVMQSEPPPQEEPQEQTLQPEATMQSEPQLPQEEIGNQQPTFSSNQNELPEEVSVSINNVMNYVTSQIVDKIKLESNMNNNEALSMQNGFNAVEQATETMANNTKGGTRKRGFRLTKRRKTIKNKTK